ncbi:MAG: DUF6975 family protein [Allosphingosinicella sp.]
MALASVETAPAPRAGVLLPACVAEHGSAAHPWCRAEALLNGPDPARDFADLIHFLCTLHGRYPGVIDHAAARIVAPEARAWIAQAAYAFAGERAYIARLAVAAGPVPSTPGASESDAAVLSQRHAVEMLARSERNGCALGAAMAVVLDWVAIRGALDAAAQRFGIEAPPYAADVGRVAAVAEGFAETPGIQRALLFGAQQIAVQHYGLWDLLETRHQARAEG